MDLFLDSRIEDFKKNIYLPLEHRGRKCINLLFIFRSLRSRAHVSRQINFESQMDLTG